MPAPTSPLPVPFPVYPPIWTLTRRMCHYLKKWCVEKFQMYVPSKWEKDLKDSPIVNNVTIMKITERV